jgi:hypothetical protein
LVNEILWLKNIKVTEKVDRKMYLIPAKITAVIVKCHDTNFTGQISIEIFKGMIYKEVSNSMMFMPCFWKIN